MSRVQDNTIYVKPSNNIYTALLAVGVVLQVVAILCVLLQYNSLFGKQIFGQ
jgi:hypothetical protein